MSWHVHKAVICPQGQSAMLRSGMFPVDCAGGLGGQDSQANLDGRKLAGLRVLHVAVVGLVGFLWGQSDFLVKVSDRDAAEVSPR